MDNYSLDEMIFLGALLNEKFPRAEHPLKKADCPSIPEFEQLAADTAGWSLKQWMHTSNCPYCQLTLRVFREEMGIKPWWERLREKAEEALAVLRDKTWAHAAGGKELVPAVLLDATSQPRLVPVEVLAARFTDDQCGRLRIKLEEPLPGISPETPLELTVVTHPEGQPLAEFVLPMLSSGQEERLKIWLTPEAREAWRKLDESTAEPSRQLPFRFILRPTVGHEVTHSSVECASASFPLELGSGSESGKAVLPRFEEVIYAVVSLVSRVFGLGRKESSRGRTTRLARREHRRILE
jgi:hypothetical protein